MRTPITDYLRDFFMSRDSQNVSRDGHVTAAQKVLERVRIMELATVKNIKENQRLLLERRAADRARQQRRRDVKKAKMCHVTGQNGLFSSDSKLEEGTLKKEVSKKERIVSKTDSQRGKNRGEPLPPTWQPNEKHYRLAAELGRPRQFADQCCQEMHDWAEANAHRKETRKSNWNAALSGWMRRNVARSPGPRRPNQPAQRSFLDIALGR